MQSPEELLFYGLQKHLLLPVVNTEASKSKNTGDTLLLSQRKKPKEARMLKCSRMPLTMSAAMHRLDSGRY